MKNPTSLSPLWNAARSDLHARRASRASRNALARELAAYSTPVEKNELNAILNRADPDAAAEIRRLLHRNPAA